MQQHPGLRHAYHSMWDSVLMTCLWSHNLIMYHGCYNYNATGPSARQQSRGHFCARPRLECPLYLTWTREIKPMESALSSMGKPHNPMVHHGFIHWNNHWGTISHEVFPALKQRSNMRNFRKVLPMTSSLMSFLWATHIFIPSRQDSFVSCTPKRIQSHHIGFPGPPAGNVWWAVHPNHKSLSAQSAKSGTRQRGRSRSPTQQRCQCHRSTGQASDYGKLLLTPRSTLLIWPIMVKNQKYPQSCFKMAAMLVICWWFQACWSAVKPRLVGGVLLGSIFHLRTKKEEGLGICFLCRSMIVWSYNMGMPFISSSIPESWLKIRCKLFLASRATSGASAQSFSASRSSKHNSWNSLFCHLPHFLAFLATSHLEVIQPYNR